MNNFCNTLTLVAITTQALQLDNDGTSVPVQPPLNAIGDITPRAIDFLNFAQQDDACTEDTVECDVENLQLEVQNNADTIASQ